MKILETLKSSGRITIKPNCNPNVENQGLEKYNMVVHPGTFQSETMACLELNGRVTYINGLNEFAPSVKKIKDEKARKAKVKEIREIVAFLEEEKAYNIIKTDDPDFWNKVTTYKPDNKALWSKVELKCGNNPINLDPVNKVEDLLLVLSIEAGGFPYVAPSKEDANNGTSIKKWYLDKQIESSGKSVSASRIKNQAGAILDNVFEKQPRKLFYVAKVIDVNGMLYTNRTLTESLYESMDNYITGKSHESNVKVAAQTFIDLCEMSLEDIKIKCIIKDAVYHKYIIPKGDGMLYFRKENIMMGRNTSEVFEFLKNPLNEDVAFELMNTVEDNW